jgi:hypothetical protein
MPWVQLAETLALVLPLLLIGYELALQRREVRSQNKLRSFELYHTLVQQYATLLLRADENPELNLTWEPVDTQRQVELDAAQEAAAAQGKAWGAWYAMEQTEKRCYRWTRSVIETFEQAYQVRQQGWIDDATWKKWLNWMLIWSRSRYFGFVFSDTGPRLIPDFVREFPLMLKQAREQADVKPFSAIESECGEGGEDAGGGSTGPPPKQWGPRSLRRQERQHESGGGA